MRVWLGWWKVGTAVCFGLLSILPGLLLQAVHFLL
jgi:hypothetical protein